MKRDPERYVHGTDAPWDEFQVVGKPHRKVDGLAKVLCGAPVLREEYAQLGMGSQYEARCGAALSVS